MEATLPFDIEYVHTPCQVPVGPDLSPTRRSSAGNKIERGTRLSVSSYVGLKQHTCLARKEPNCCGKINTWSFVNQCIMLLSCKSWWCKPMSRKRNCLLVVVVDCLIIHGDAGGGNKRRRGGWKPLLAGQERLCNTWIAKVGQDSLSGPLPQHPVSDPGRPSSDSPHRDGGAVPSPPVRGPCPPKKSSFRSAPSAPWETQGLLAPPPEPSPAHPAPKVIAASAGLPRPPISC